MYTRGVIFYEEDDDLDVVPKSPPQKNKESFEKDMALLSFLVVFWHLVDQKKRERSFSFLKRKDRSIDRLKKHFGRGVTKKKKKKK